MSTASQQQPAQAARQPEQPQSQRQAHQQSQSQRQQSQQTQQTILFRAGVTACLRSWSALRTAVESGWGGGESYDKAEDLRTNVCENFDCSNRCMERHDLEDALTIYMEEEFSVQLEDDSERQIAETICDLHDRCCCFGDRNNNNNNNNQNGHHPYDRDVYNLVRRMMASSSRAAQQSGQYPVQIHSTELDDSDDDDNDNDAEMEVCDDTTDTTDNSNSNSNAISIAAGQQQQPHPVTATTTATPTQPPSSISLSSMERYSNEALFGGVGKNEKKSPSMGNQDAAVRQLGQQQQQPVDNDNNHMDEDGFITVPATRRRK